jgi:hypothetical protein
MGGPPAIGTAAIHRTAPGCLSSRSVQQKNYKSVNRVEGVMTYGRSGRGSAQLSAAAAVHRAERRRLGRPSRLREKKRRRE